MSDYDDDTDDEIAEALEKLNCRLVRAGKIHAAEDAIMIQAYKRLQSKKDVHDKTPATECNRCHKLDSIFVKTTNGLSEKIYCINCLVDLIDLKRMKELNEKFNFQSFILKSGAREPSAECCK